MKSLFQETNFAAFGFFPSRIQEKKMEIHHGSNNIAFDPGFEEFEEIDISDYEGDHSKKIHKATKNNSWFDDFRIVQFANKKIKDPFLFGIKDGKYYLISFWDTDVWE